MFRNFNVLPVRDIYRYLSLIMVYSSVNGMGLQNMFRRYMRAYNTCLNSRVTLDFPFAKTNIFKNSFRIHATLMWNTLPSHLIHKDDYKKFKFETKKYLMYNFTN